MVESYLFEVEREISKLESYSKLPKINFIKALKMARSIKARSIWIGAKGVSFQSPFVVDACLGFDEESLSDAIEGLRIEFNRIKMKFVTYLELYREMVEKDKELGGAKK